MSTTMESIWEITSSSLGISPVYSVLDVLPASKLVYVVVFPVVIGCVILVLRDAELKATVSILPLPQNIPLLFLPYSFNTNMTKTQNNSQ